MTIYRHGMSFRENFDPGVYGITPTKQLCMRKPVKYEYKMTMNEQMVLDDLDSCGQPGTFVMSSGLYSFLSLQNHRDDPETDVYFFHPDHLGSTSYITAFDGTPYQHVDYLPFGEVLLEEKADTWLSPYKFNCKELDDESGLYYYGARYYDPRTSVFLRVDPMSDKYPGLSSFAYCMNNPMRMIDPDGRESYEIDENSGKVKLCDKTQYYQRDDKSILSLKDGQTTKEDISAMRHVDKVSNSDGGEMYTTAGILGKEYSNGSKQWFTFGNSNEAEEFYYFAASSTRAEYAFAKFGNMGGLVGTDGSDKNTSMTGFFERNWGNIISLLSHSHTGSGGPPSYDITTKGTQQGDLNTASNSKYNFLREVYSVANSTLYEYSGGTLRQARQGGPSYDASRKRR